MKTEDLCFSYHEGSPVLRGVNLEISKGSFVAVVGRNGSGKSTLAKHFNGILLPTSGRVLVNGLDTSLPENLLPIRQQAGMVFQNPDNQIVAAVVEEDVAFAPENMGVPSAEIRLRVDRALEAVGMKEYAKFAPHKLSGGQKQRIAIAGILAMHPQILILDEPSAMLDPNGRAEVLQTVMRLNREEGITVLMITHHMPEAVCAQRVVVMDRGQIAMDGTPEEVFSRVDDVVAAGLTVPPVTQLMYTLAMTGLDCNPYVLHTAQCVEALEALLRKEGVAQA